MFILKSHVRSELLSDGRNYEVSGGSLALSKQLCISLLLADFILNTKITQCLCRFICACLCVSISRHFNVHLDLVQSCLSTSGASETLAGLFFACFTDVRNQLLVVCAEVFISNLRK